MKRLVYISFLSLLSLSNAAAQTPDSEIPAETLINVLETPPETATLQELKSDVLSLSYKKNGKRVFVLRSEEGLEKIIEPAEDDVEGSIADKKEAKRKKRRKRKRRRAIRNFEVECNPLGEAMSLEVSETDDDVDGDAVEVKKGLRHRRMKRLAELACLEPEFEAE